MVLELYPYEYDNLVDITEGMMGKDSVKGTWFTEGNVSNRVAHGSGMGS